MITVEQSTGIWAGVAALISPSLVFVAAWLNLRVKGISVEDAARLADRGHFREEMKDIVKEAREDARIAREDARMARAEVRDAQTDRDRVRAEYVLLHKALQDSIKEATARETTLQQKISDIIEMSNAREMECKERVDGLMARIEAYESKPKMQPVKTVKKRR